MQQPYTGGRAPKTQGLYRLQVERSADPTTSPRNGRKQLSDP